MRIRSLLKDVNDDNIFRHGRQKHVGTIFNEFNQPCPFFFTRDRMPLHLIGQYRGRSAFMVCNGPSVAKLNLSLLKKPGVITYGINNGPRTIRPNFWTCVDDPKRFLKSIWLDSLITKFVPHSFANKQIFDNEKWVDMLDKNNKPVIVGDCPNVIYFHRNEKFVAERFLCEDTINWGCHGDYGGSRSVMLPVFRILFLLGFRKIYLLGADFKMSENYTYHFDEQRSKGAVKCNNNTYDRLKSEYLPALKKVFEEEGLEVWNCNPESELKVFPFKKYEEAINETIAPLGDVEHERTWGMYSKPEERQKWKVEPLIENKTHCNITGGNKEPIYVINEKTDNGCKVNPLNINTKPVKEIVPIDSIAIGNPTVNETRIIKKIPCGSISRGSSTQDAKNITIEDNGN